MYQEKILGSKFIGCIFKVNKFEEIKAIFLNLKNEHHKAKHIVYAYVCDNGKIIGKHNAREPKNTAALPILNFLLHKKAMNVVIFVIRYSKGRKMGKNNLAKSYLKIAQKTYQNWTS